MSYYNFYSLIVNMGWISLSIQWISHGCFFNISQYGPIVQHQGTIQWEWIHKRPNQCGPVGPE